MAYNYGDTISHSILDMVKYIAKADPAKGKPGMPSLKIGYSEILNERVIKPSESIDIYTAKDSASIRMAHAYFDQLNIKIDYCSIYVTCWRFEDDEIIELN